MMSSLLQTERDCTSAAPIAKKRGITELYGSVKQIYSNEENIGYESLIQSLIQRRQNNSDDHVL